MTSPARVISPCAASSDGVHDSAPSARRSSRHWRSTDSFHEPEAGTPCQYLYSGKSDPPSNGSNCHTQLGGGRGEPSSGNVNGLSPFGCLSTFSKEIHIDTKSCGIVDDGNPKTPLLPFPTTAWGNTSFVSGSAGGFQKPVTDPWNVTFGSGGGSSGGSGFAPSFNSSNGDVAPVFMIPPGGLAPGNHAFAKVCWENVPGASSPTCMTLEVCCWCPGAPNGQSPKPPSKP